MLIGARKIHAQLFDGIAWGSCDVFAQQGAALAKTGLSHMALAPSWGRGSARRSGAPQNDQAPLAFEW